MQDTPDTPLDHGRNEPDEYVRAGGPYADLIRELVDSGRFDNPAEVLLEALSLLEHRELARKASEAALEARIQEGIDAADRGELIPAEEVFARLKEKYEAQARNSRK